MPTKNPEPPDDSTTQNMRQALDMAAEKLSRNITSCLEDLKDYNASLEKGFCHQLAEIKDQFLSFAEHHSQELEEHQENLTDQLQLFEEEQVQTIVSAGRSVRESLSAHGKFALEGIGALVEETMNKLASGLLPAHASLKENLASALPALEATASTGQEHLEELSLEGEKELENSVQKFQLELSNILSTWKEDIAVRIDGYQAKLSGQTKAAVAELSTLNQQAETVLNSEFDDGTGKIEVAIESGFQECEQLMGLDAERFSITFQDLKSSTDNKRAALDADLDAVIESRIKQTNESTKDSRSAVEQKLHHACKHYQRIFTTMERNHTRQLEQLFRKFELLLDEVSRLSGTHKLDDRMAAELEERLDSNLSAASAELVKSVTKLGQELAIDYARSMTGFAEKVENIKSNAIDALEKRVQTGRSETQKLIKSFKAELQEIEDQLGQVDEVGKAAAATVSAYRSALLSLGED